MTTDRVKTALPPLEFQFTNPADVAKYGDRWYRYSEADIIRRPARELMSLESQTGIPMIDMMNGVRISSVAAELAATWIAVRDVDPVLAGEFDGYNPVVMAALWRSAVDEGKDSSESVESGPETSAPTDTVTLQTLPVAG